MLSFQFPYSNYKPGEIDLTYIQMSESQIIQWCLRHCHVYFCTEWVMCKTLKEMCQYCLTLLLCTLFCL